MNRLPSHFVALMLVVPELPQAGEPPTLVDKQKQLDAQTFWDNRDWDWYREHIPFFECPDADITAPNASDWLQIDFGSAQTVSRVELAIYNDRGGVQAPARYAVQLWDGATWRDAAEPHHTPAEPVGGQWNEVRFRPTTTTKLRVVFSHRGGARSGVSEVLVWREAQN